MNDPRVNRGFHWSPHFTCGAIASHRGASYHSDGMLDRLTDFLGRHQMFPLASKVGIAVSGGADSVFLLHALGALAPGWNLQLSVVHIEHGIRSAASLEDADFVKQLAAS